MVYIFMSLHRFICPYIDICGGVLRRPIYSMYRPGIRRGYIYTLFFFFYYSGEYIRIYAYIFYAYMHIY
jgi:hypothetical protein